MESAFDKGIFLKNGGFGRAQNTFTFCPNRKLGVSYRRGSPVLAGSPCAQLRGIYGCQWMLERDLRETQIVDVRLVRLVVCSSIGPAIIGICLIQRF